jgi:hypothetical protein
MGKGRFLCDAEVGQGIAGLIVCRPSVWQFRPIDGRGRVSSEEGRCSDWVVQTVGLGRGRRSHV